LVGGSNPSGPTNIFNGVWLLFWQPVHQKLLRSGEIPGF
jgi:hypothetical protein